MWLLLLENWNFSSIQFFLQVNMNWTGRPGCAGYHIRYVGYWLTQNSKIFYNFLIFQTLDNIPHKKLFTQSDSFCYILFITVCPYSDSTALIKPTLEFLIVGIKIKSKFFLALRTHERLFLESWFFFEIFWKIYFQWKMKFTYDCQTCCLNGYPTPTNLNWGKKWLLPCTPYPRSNCFWRKKPNP